MTSQSKKNESNKLPKRVFAPPVVKSYSTPFGKGELELHGKAEDGVTAKSIINMLPVQSKRQTERTANVEKKSQCKKNLEMIENEKECLTDAQFEEIVQSVLQKSPQECMEKFQKRRVSAESAEGQPSSREASEAFLPAERNGSWKKTEVGRRGHQIKTKKQSKFGADKGEKKLNEKAPANNVGCKANRKREPKKAAQGGDAQDVIDPEEAPEEEEEEEEAAGGSGSRRCCTAWIQCSYPSCEKWRRLSSDVDPSALPEDWSCSQNPDLQHNSCSVPEEDWSGSENEVVYAIYFPGSIVWAKQYGYPWWPGIIEADPDIEEYFLFSSQADSLPSKYHVTFFGHPVTRAWISASQLKNYGEAAGEGSVLAKIRNKSEKKDLRLALEMAKEAERISIQDRIRRFGFQGRFRNQASPRDDKILKEQNNSASRPPVKGPPETKGGNKNAAASSKNPEKLLRELSVVEPIAKVKTTINVKGGKKAKLGPESASPVLKKSQPQRTAPNAAATLRGPDQATGKQKRSQKGWKPSFSAPQGQMPRARHPHSYPDSSSPADIAASR
ncbi:zinc finger CW-type PWWP domain protein 1-like isoform X2 [Crotalus tigris]|uniref:zinc finger CW-type PWWP domain protein 1-like isoform X2 n=1 Tax=Crotalus tigris TaxID=88082 RepID=UPI00192F3CC7|nr:zinc finger CW-type PWWP domain protein 1-like isoform X2 [Crotalus tigris]